MAAWFLVLFVLLAGLPMGRLVSGKNANAPVVPKLFVKETGPIQQSARGTDTAVGAGQTGPTGGSVSTVVATIVVPSFPTEVAYDPANGDLYLVSVEACGNWPTCEVTVISGSTNTVVTTIPIGRGPYAEWNNFPITDPWWEPPTYDPANGDLYVSNWQTNGTLLGGNVTVISGSTNTVVGYISTDGYAPDMPAYDPANGDLYVANTGYCVITGCGGDGIAVISGSTNRLVTTIPIGMPTMPTYDPANADLYVPEFYANWGAWGTSVISTANDTTVAWINAEGASPTYDPANGDVYMSDDWNNVFVISGSNNTIVATIPVGHIPDTPTYDPSNGNLYVANRGSGNATVAGNVTVISGSTNTVVATVPVGAGPEAPIYDPDNGFLFVPNRASDNVTVISGSTNTVVATVPVGIGPWTPTYDPANGEVYVPNFGSSGVANSSSVSVISVEYPVTFTEAGLPSGTDWQVTLGTSTLYSTSSSITFMEPKGTYDFTVGSAAGYAATPASGSVMVSNESLIQPITFAPTYAVSFAASGLPAGTNWSVTFNTTTKSSTGSSISFSAPNGTYSFAVGSVSGYASSPASGTLTVTGAAVTKAIAFTAFHAATTYAVTFDETGLAGGTSWSVTLDGNTESSSLGSIAFTEPNGTYAFSVGPVPGYSPSAAFGSVVVSGGAVSRTVAFWSTVAASSVVFTEDGLPSGTMWSVTLNGTAESSWKGSLAFTEPNGTYDFTVGTVSGYVAIPVSGSLRVSGQTVTQSVTFTANTTSSASGGLPGLAGGEWYYLVGGVAGVAAAVAAGFVVVRRRRAR